MKSLEGRFNDTGANLETEVRVFMAHVIAKALRRSTCFLPVMSDAQLWQSYKLAAFKISSYRDLPSVITDPLSPGEIFAFELGKHFDTSVFPQGNDLEEIWDNARLNGADAERTSRSDSESWFYMYLKLTPFILRDMNHPKAGAFSVFVGEE